MNPMFKMHMNTPVRVIFATILLSSLTWGCSTTHDKSGVSQKEVYLTRDDLKKLNSIKFESARCVNCATVLRAPVGPTTQPPCPATRPNCIALCDSTDPLDGVNDMCSTLKWECLGCGGSGGDLCCTESNGTCNWHSC